MSSYKSNKMAYEIISSCRMASFWLLEIPKGKELVKTIVHVESTIHWES